MNQASTPLNLLVAAEEGPGAQLLRALSQTAHRVVALLSSVSGEPPAASPLGQVAKARDLPIWPAERVRDPAFADLVRKEGVDLLVNAHSLHVIHPAVLQAPRIGSFNLHPGRLPSYSGLNSISWAIYQGESTAGVTVHWMTPRIDAGPIAYEASVPIEERDTAFTLGAKCSRAGVDLLARLIESAAADPGGIPARQQPLAERRYYGRGAPQDGRVDWARSAVEIVRFVRACNYGPFPSPWGQPLTTVDVDRELAILQADRTGRRSGGPPGTVGSRSGGAVEIAAADEWVLVRRVRWEGEARDAAQVLRSGQRCAAPPNAISSDARAT
jgi:UDP-4-amino-4-deoxy-L-arabinose formyltransferase/UDP-glucuronic acid dehydrogenase (UDP-4-keto-hexauronic acid decarboxylating)